MNLIPFLSIFPTILGGAKTEKLLPDQINMVVFSGTLLIAILPVYTTAHPYTRQVTFCKLPETHGYVQLVTLYPRWLRMLKN